MKIIPVILSGGSGTRLWPLSRGTYPKQFLDLLDGRSLFQATLDRLSELNTEAPIVVASEPHRFLVAEQLRQRDVAGASIILEPEGRNTAPAIAVAAELVKSQGNDTDSLLLVLPADHNIKDVAAFGKAIETGKQAATEGKLVTFGIKPDAAETGFGYIQAGSALSDGVFDISQFVEKPDAATAQQYLDAGDYSWNSGMFLFSVDKFLAELEKFQPEMVTACSKAVAGGHEDLDFFRLDAHAFRASPSDSIDYAVMEQTNDAAVVLVDIGWSDVGSWGSLADIYDHDSDGNSTHGDVLLQDCKNTMAYSENKLVTVVGVEDLVIVETLDAVLVTHKDKSQQVGELVKHLKSDDRLVATEHRKIYRPWGSYDSIDYGDRFQVKRITVNPGAELSLQKHHHRAEHWIIVSGTAEVTCDENVMMMEENTSTYIPLGSVHRLANRGVIPLELIEVQSGSYLGEDDIVRLEDNYGRKGTNT